MKRRHFLNALLGAAAGALPSPAAAGNAALTPVAPLPVADVELVLRAAPEQMQLLTGASSQVWRFTGRLMRGASGSLDAPRAGYLGPTLRVKRGQRVRIHFDNALDEPSIVHWHGLDVAEKNDGHPLYAVEAGKRYTYDFSVENRAGTYWYHPHPDGRTAPQVYRGLAGLLLVSDEEEQRLGLPDGDRELALVLQDRTFDESNQLVYAPRSMLGFLGRSILVNGGLPGALSVPRGPHRLRLLNGSNSRIYDLSWSDGSPLTVLGTDGGLLAAPLERSHVVLAPGQRLDVWANFGGGLGDDVWLQSKAFDGVDPAMAMGMGRGGPSGLANGQPFRIQRFVASGKRVRAKPPAKLAVIAPPPTALAAPAKSFTVQMGGMRWLLNGRPFAMREVAANERVRLGALEDWEFSNPAGPMAMAHPIHLHGSQFRVIERRAGRGALGLREGILDEGWQDTFLLLPGDTVRIQKRFEHYPGLFLYHCHNLEHEDMGMMRNFLVEG